MKGKILNSLPLFPVLAIVFFSVTIYGNSLKNGFVYDDATTIVGNSFIKHLSNLPGLLNKEIYFSQSGEMTYRPVVTFTYFLDYALYGLNPSGFHLTNILLHAINGILLYLFLTFIIHPSVVSSLKLTSHFSLITNQSLIISLLFITHPVLTEAVNAVSFREDLLVFLFYIATLILYLKLRLSLIPTHRLPTIMIYLISCFSYILALFSKEMAVTLPLIIYCYEWIYSYRKNSFISIMPNSYNIGYIILTLIYFYFRFYFFSNPVDRVDPEWQVNERLVTLPLLLLYYLKITILPISLSADYNITSIKLFSSYFIISLVAVASFLTGAFLLRKRYHGITFGALFFAITLLPVYNIIPIGNPFAERYLYLPVLGFACASGLAIHRMASLSERYRLFCIILTSILFMFAVLIVQRNSIWKDDYSLWSDTLKKIPGSAGAHYGMGNAFVYKGMLDEAIQEYKESIRLAPYYPEAFNALGLAYYKKGMGKEGKEAMAAASEARGLINYYKKGLVEDAIIQYKKALKIDPTHKDARYNLDLLYQEQGMVEKAIKEYIVLLQYKPDDFDTLNSLGLAFFQKGFFEKALSLYRKTLDIDPESVTPYNNIGMVYAVRGQTEEAEKWFKKGLTVDPESAEACYNLGFLYQSNGKLAEAVEAYKEAISIRPDYEEARDRLRELEER